VVACSGGITGFERTGGRNRVVSTAKSKLRLKDNRGFSLAELLAVTGIISIVTAIAIPSFMTVQPGMRLNGAARQVFGKLMWARAQAVEENTTYSVAFPNNHSLTIINDTNGNGAADVGEATETVDLQTDYPDVTFVVGGSDTTPNFNGRGTTSGQTTVTVSNSSGSRVVTVTVTGNVKIN